MKRKRRVFGALILILALTLIALAIVPGYIDSRENSTIKPGPYVASATATYLHERLFIGDMHADTLLWNRDLLATNTRGHVDLPRLVKGNVALQVFTAVTKIPRAMNYNKNSGDTDQITLLAIAQRWPTRTWFSLHERALYIAERFTDAVARSQGSLVLITNARQLNEFVDKRKTQPHLVAGILGIEGLHCLEGHLENVGVFYDAGFRLMGITHFFDNELAGSAHGLDKKGLTDFGRQVIAEMEGRKIIVDLAHASPATVDDVLQIATRPVVVSHTGVKGTCDNPRNLSDEHVKRIAEKGGLIGIGYWDGAVCGSSVDNIVAAIKYTVNLAGVDHVALGSDFDGGTREPFDSSGVIKLTEALLAAGFSEHDIALIMGGNELRFMRENLPPT